MKAHLINIEDKVSYNTISVSVANTPTLKRLKGYIGKEITLIIDELKQARTLTQNAYMWLLVGKIAETLGRAKDDVYKDFLKAYGQSVMISVKNEDAKEFERKAKYHELESSDDERTVYRFIAGSSEYDTVEMKKLLDGVIVEAEGLGIPTLTQKEIEKMNLK